MTEPAEYRSEFERGMRPDTEKLSPELQPSQTPSRVDNVASPADPAPADTDVPLPAETGVVSADSTVPIASTKAARDTEPFSAVFQSLAVTVVIAVFVITFIVQAFQIPSESMEDTLLIGDYLLVDKAHFGPAGGWSRLLPYSKVHRGDIAVFRYPIHPTQHFVKRVVGVPGDHIKLVKKRLFVNGTEVPEPYVVYKRHDHDSFRDNFPTGDSLSPSIEAGWYLELRRLTENGQLIVPQGYYFVLGDNREESLDSRYWGFVPQENVIGRPLLIYWSVQRRDVDEDAAVEAADGKLARFSRAVANTFYNIRWFRTLRLVR